MRAEETAIFSDLDGTLFAAGCRISPENRAAIERYMAEGGLFALSTGRAPENALRFVGDLPTNCPSVVYNGAGVYDFAKREYGWLRHLENDRVFPLLRWALAHVPGLDLQLYLDREIVYCTPLETAQQAFLGIHQPTRYVPLDTLEGGPVVKCLLLAPPEYDELLGEELRRRAPGCFDLKRGAVVLDDYISYYELMPDQATKGSALHALRSHPLLQGRTILAAGDYWNDYELLQEADVSVAPDNAPDEIKAICTRTTVSNEDHAIKHIIEDIIPSL